MSGRKSEAGKRAGKPEKKTRRTLTVEEAAAILGISRAGAYRLVHSGELPSLRLGARVLISDLTIERLLGAST
jgi:excisionase family DNA binding protein